MLKPGEIEAILQGGHELRGFEVKGSAPRTDTHLFAKVARAALSLANLRDGGHVVIGIDNDDPANLLPGLDAAELASWMSFDDVSRKLREYADPPVRFDLVQQTLSSGANVAVIQVHEFADLPVLCAKDYPGVLRKGACYVRSRGVPETAEVATSHEMRDILDLATEKALRAYIEKAQRAGVSLTTSDDREPRVTDAALFAQQRENTW